MKNYNEQCFNVDKNGERDSATGEINIELEQKNSDLADGNRVNNSHNVESDAEKTNSRQDKYMASLFDSYNRLESQAKMFWGLAHQGTWLDYTLKIVIAICALKFIFFIW